MRFGLFTALVTLVSLSRSCNAGPPPTPTADPLPAGLRLIVSERHANPLVAIDLWIRAGSREEADGEIGAAHFLEHTLFKGTRSRSAGAVDLAIESLGGTLDAATGPDYAHFYTTVPAEQLEPALRIVADVVSNATLPDAEVDRERGVILDELAQHSADGAELLVDLLFANGFRSGPYRRSPGGTPAAIAARGRDTLAAFYRRCYTPDRATLVLVGDCSAAAARRATAQAFRDWKLPDARVTSASPLPEESRFALLPQRLSIQANTASERLGLAFPAPAAGEVEDAAVGRLVAALLGSSTGHGRLRSLRLPGVEAAARYVPRRDPTLFLLTATWRGSPRPTPPPFDGVASALEQALGSLLTAPPSRDEIDAAARELIGQMQYEEETDAGLAYDLGYADLTGGERPDALRRRLAQIPLTAVTHYVQRYLSPPQQLALHLLPASPPTGADR